MLSFAVMWAAMVVAMALTVLRPARRLALGSPRRFAAFLVGYALTWSAVGVIAWALMPALAGSAVLLFTAWLAVGVWQTLPVTARLLRRCRGLSARSSVLVSGMRQGSWCTASCAPLMVVAMATLHVMGVGMAVMSVAMVALAAFSMWERRPSVPLGLVRATGIAMILAAAGSFVLIAPHAMA